MLHEHDVVKTTKPFSSNAPNAWPVGTDITLPTGTIGAIVMVFTDDAPNYAYEVEFVDEDGGTLALLTLQEEDITLVQPYSQISSVTTHE
jgi:hypothetical protein